MAPHFFFYWTCPCFCALPSSHPAIFLDPSSPLREMNEKAASVEVTKLNIFVAKQLSESGTGPAGMNLTSFAFHEGPDFLHYK